MSQFAKACEWVTVHCLHIESKTSTGLHSYLPQLGRSPHRCNVAARVRAHVGEVRGVGGAGEHPTVRVCGGCGGVAGGGKVSVRPRQGHHSEGVSVHVHRQQQAAHGRFHHAALPHILLCLPVAGAQHGVMTVMRALRNLSAQAVLAQSSCVQTVFPSIDTVNTHVVVIE